VYERETRREDIQRPFVLTRSSFFGTQKYAAKWTGDNRATNDEIVVSMNQMLSLGVSGIPFVGADIPGFYGNATEELFVKFYQLGAFFPFMRAHSHKEMINREPWAQTEMVQRTIKEAVFLRYDLMHYLYTQFYIASKEGTPIMRPMHYEFPGDSETFGLNQQFMWGDSMLFAPKVKKAMYKQSKYYFPRSEDDSDKWWSVDVYLPSRQNAPFDTLWYSYNTK
jgi:alpha-glucosidase (family GH31 glycosyl hydrolase)